MRLPRNTPSPRAGYVPPREQTDKDNEKNKPEAESQNPSAHAMVDTKLSHCCHPLPTPTGPGQPDLSVLGLTTHLTAPAHTDHRHDGMVTNT